MELFPILWISYYIQEVSLLYIFSLQTYDVYDGHGNIVKHFLWWIFLEDNPPSEVLCGANDTLSLWIQSIQIRNKIYIQPKKQKDADPIDIKNKENSSSIILTVEQISISYSKYRF